MRLYNIYGRVVHKNVSSKIIDWDGKSRSKLQFKVKQFFKEHWYEHICYEEFPVYGTKMSVDILNATKRIAIEVNGPQHEEYNKFFHKNKVNYFNSIKRDFKKREWLESNDFLLMEINVSEANKLSKSFIKNKFDVSL
jgi:hypothetical protein